MNIPRTGPQLNIMKIIRSRRKSAQLLDVRHFRELVRSFHLVELEQLPAQNRPKGENA